MMPSADQDLGQQCALKRGGGASGLSLPPDRPVLHSVLFALPTFTSRQLSAIALGSGLN